MIVEIWLVLWSIYTHRHCMQRCDNSAMMLTILFSLSTVKSFQNGLNIPIQERLHVVTSMRTGLVASMHSCRSIDTDAWCITGSYDGKIMGLQYRLHGTTVTVRLTQVIGYIALCGDVHMVRQRQCNFTSEWVGWISMRAFTLVTAFVAVTVAPCEWALNKYALGTLISMIKCTKRK